MGMPSCPLPRPARQPSGLLTYPLTDYLAQHFLKCEEEGDRLVASMLPDEGGGTGGLHGA